MASGSGFAMRFKITPEGGEAYEVTSAIIDIVRFERAMKKGFGTSGDIHITDMLWVAFSASYRTKITTEKDFDKWCKSVDDFEVLESDREIDQAGGLDEVETDGDSDSDPTHAVPQLEGS